MKKKPSYQRLKRRIAQIVEADIAAGPAQLSLLLPLLGIEVNAAIACGLTTKQLTQLLQRAGLHTSQRSVERHLPQIARRRLGRTDKAIAAKKSKPPTPSSKPFTDPFAKPKQPEMVNDPHRKQPLLSYDDIEKRAREDVFPGIKKVAKASVAHRD